VVTRQGAPIVTARRHRRGIACRLLAGAALVWTCVPAAHAQESLARAKDLYMAASYDEALSVLDRLQKESPADAPTEVAQYRVFCLLALERGSEARAAIEALVKADPFYRPSDAQTPPRIRAMIADTRKAVLPSIVQSTYSQAEASFDKKDPRAAAEFDRVLALLDDPDMPREGSANDLRMVATGFRDLAKAAAAPPLPPPQAAPVAAASVPAPAPPSPAASAQAAPAGVSTPRPSAPAPVANAPSPRIVAPVTISQPLPRWTPLNPADSRVEFRGSIEVAIDERGAVSGVEMRQSVHPTYDTQLMQMARNWKYRPATRNGVPIPYLKVVEIQLTPVR
jgi:TonB family protein